MQAHLRANLVLIAATLVLCSVAYPLVVWIAGCFVPTMAAGSLLRGADEKPVGSALIAQEFKGDEYFQPRPSAASYNASASSGSNWSANNPKLRDRVARQLGPIVKYRNGQPVGPDVEKWFHAEPDRLAKWAAGYPTLAGAWLSADPLNVDYVKQWLVDHQDIAMEWKKTHDDEPKPEDVAVEFFTSFAQAHPGTIPDIVETKKGDKIEKNVQPVADGGDVQSWFFDAWLQEHGGAELELVPADLVTASGSGLDPHITLRGARYQLERVAAAWAEKTKREPGAVREEIVQVLNGNKFSPLGGLGGEPLVNVLEVNLTLQKRFAVKGK